jgi:hypothetical protein
MCLSKYRYLGIAVIRYFFVLLPLKEHNVFLKL